MARHDSAIEASYHTVDETYSEDSGHSMEAASHPGSRTYGSPGRDARSRDLLSPVRRDRRSGEGPRARRRSSCSILSSPTPRMEDGRRRQWRKEMLEMLEASDLSGDEGTTLSAGADHRGHGPTAQYSRNTGSGASTPLFDESDAVSSKSSSSRWTSQADRSYRQQREGDVVRSWGERADNAVGPEAPRSSALADRILDDELQVKREADVRSGARDSRPLEMDPPPETTTSTGESLEAATTLTLRCCQ